MAVSSARGRTRWQQKSLPMGEALPASEVLPPTRLSPGWHCSLLAGSSPWPQLPGRGGWRDGAMNANGGSGGMRPSVADKEGRPRDGDGHAGPGRHDRPDGHRRHPCVAISIAVARKHDCFEEYGRTTGGLSKEPSQENALARFRPFVQATWWTTF
jgi:hypothetical protein